MKIYAKHIIFSDIVDMLYSKLNSLQYSIKLCDKILKNDSELYIILGGAELPEIPPQNYIIYQMEQCNSKNNSWFSEKYINLLKNAKYIWDYSKENINYLIENYKFNNIYYVPFYYSLANDHFNKKINKNKTIDILFLGSLNKRRSKLLNKLKSKYKVHIGNYKLWGKERDKVIMNSKIVINIHYYENAILEMARLSYLLSNRAFVISECGREKNLVKEMEQYAILDKYNNLVKLVDKYMQNEELRNNTRNKFIKNWQKTNYSIPQECFNNELTKKTRKRKKKYKIEYYIPEKIKSIDYTVTEDGECILKLPQIYDENLPKVSIITPTKNRRQLFKLAINNFNNFIYPKDKLEWIIIDNGSDKIEDLLPTNANIKYFKLDDTINYNIGSLRNLCIEKASNDYIVYMDDDDYYTPESILARVKSLIKYKNEGIECVGCVQIGCYNICNGQSVIGSNSEMYLPEASIAHTRKFWEDRKYDMDDKIGEYKYFLMYRQHKIKTIPYQFVMIALNHKNNTTGTLRYYKNYKEWVKKYGNKFTFYDLFDNTVKKIISKC